MEIYFIIMHVEIKTSRFQNLTNSQGYCWLRATSVESALNKAVFAIRKDGNQPLSITDLPIIVTEEDFKGQDIELENFDHAQKNGISIAYSAKTNEVNNITIERFSDNYSNINYNEILQLHKSLTKESQCLHFYADSSCLNPINSHTIQKSKMLSSISREGHVYTGSTDYFDSLKNGGKLTFKLKGIKQVSTFPGFCQKHDTELFKPIDTSFLIPTNKQVILYAYRAISKEVFLKGNILIKYRKMLNSQQNPVVQGLWYQHLKGTQLGYNNLITHKENYDKSLKDKTYDDINYVLFSSTRKPNIAFSSLLYPYYDFHGNSLQLPENSESKLDLLTFSSALMEKGWGYIIAWHKSSNKVAMKYINSLKKSISEGNKPEDLLFRQTLHFENTAYSPDWLENLNAESRTKILNTFEDLSDPLTPYDYFILTKGFENLSEWKFDQIIEKLPVD